MSHHGPHSAGRQLGLLLHLGGILAVVLVLSAGWWASRTIHQRLQDAQRTCAQASNLLRRETYLRRQHEGALEALRNTETEVEELLQKIPDTPRETDFLQQLARLGAETQVEIREFVPGQALKASLCQHLVVQVQVEGSFPGICRFLSGLETLPRLCRVSQANLSAPPNPEQPIALDLQLELAFGVTPPAIQDDPL